MGTIVEGLRKVSTILTVGQPGAHVAHVNVHIAIHVHLLLQDSRISIKIRLQRGTEFSYGAVLALRWGQLRLAGVMAE